MTSSNFIFFLNIQEDSILKKLAHILLNTLQTTEP
jgi:hypothetical protein